MSNPERLLERSLNTLIALPPMLRLADIRLSFFVFTSSDDKRFAAYDRSLELE